MGELIDHPCDDRVDGIPMTHPEYPKALLVDAILSTQFSVRLVRYTKITGSELQPSRGGCSSIRWYDRP